MEPRASQDRKGSSSPLKSAISPTFRLHGRHITSPSTTTSGRFRPAPSLGTGKAKDGTKPPPAPAAAQTSGPGVASTGKTSGLEDERFKFLLQHGVVRSIEGTDRIIFAELPNLPLIVYRSPAEREMSPERFNLDRRKLQVCPLLEGEEKLRLLNYQKNHIRRLDNFVSLPSLIFLDLYSNHIEQIENLQTVPTLKVLMLGKNHVRGGVQHLSVLPRLDVLDLHGNQLAEFPIHEGAPLRVLNLASNLLANHFEIPYPLVNLIELNVRRNKVQFLGPLDERTPMLQRLYASHNQLAVWRSVGCLDRMRKLTDLSLDHNPLSNNFAEQDDIKDTGGASAEAKAGESGDSTQPPTKGIALFRMQVIRKCPTLKNLDDRSVSDQERIHACGSETVKAEQKNEVAESEVRGWISSSTEAEIERKRKASLAEDRSATGLCPAQGEAETDLLLQDLMSPTKPLSAKATPTSLNQQRRKDHASVTTPRAGSTSGIGSSGASSSPAVGATVSLTSDARGAREQGLAGSSQQNGGSSGRTSGTATGTASASSLVSGVPPTSARRNVDPREILAKINFNAAGGDQEVTRSSSASSSSSGTLELNAGGPGGPTGGPIGTSSSSGGALPDRQQSKAAWLENDDEGGHAAGNAAHTTSNRPLDSISAGGTVSSSSSTASRARTPDKYSTRVSGSGTSMFSAGQYRNEGAFDDDQALEAPIPQDQALLAGPTEEILTGESPQAAAFTGDASIVDGSGGLQQLTQHQPPGGSTGTSNSSSSSSLAGSASSSSSAVIGGTVAPLPTTSSSIGTGPSGSGSADASGTGNQINATGTTSSSSTTLANNKAPVAPSPTEKKKKGALSRVDVLNDIRQQWMQAAAEGKTPATRYGYVKREEAFELFIYGRGLDAMDKPEYQAVVSSIHFLFLSMSSVLKCVDKLRLRFGNLTSLSFSRNQIASLDQLRPLRSLNLRSLNVFWNPINDSMTPAALRAQVLFILPTLTKFNLRKVTEAEAKQVQRIFPIPIQQLHQSGKELVVSERRPHRGAVSELVASAVAGDALLRRLDGCFDNTVKDLVANAWEEAMEYV
ncbi:unnamed protein product [Amoebophrya sp. A25]|nr:unnamed protein product [Amoebophrya sp. A25]|eukprot:GSA25T00023201001.1